MLQQRIHRHRCKTGGHVTDAIGDNQGAVMHHAAAGIDDIGDIAAAFIRAGSHERFTELSDDLGGIFKIQQGGGHTVFAHGTDPMGQQEPASFSFNGGAAVADLDELPGVLRLLNEFGLFPDVYLVAAHEEEVLTVDATDHGILTVNTAREQGHALVAGAVTHQGHNMRTPLAADFDELR